MTDVRGHLLIFKCEYEISPNLGMLANARQVPVFGFGLSLLKGVLILAVSKTTENSKRLAHIFKLKLFFDKKDFEIPKSFVFLFIPHHFKMARYKQKYEAFRNLKVLLIIERL